MSIASDFLALGDTMVGACEERNRARKDIQAKVKKIQTEVKEMMYVFKDMVTDRKRGVAEMKKEVTEKMNDIKNRIHEARAAWSNVMSKMSEVRSGI